MASEQTGVLAALSDELAAAVETAGQSVVRVDARRRHNPASGIVWSNGLVLTADHVLEREEEIGVGLPDGKEVPGRIAGRDPGTDIALLKVSAGGLTPIQTREQVKIGNLVLAISRAAPSGLAATMGIVGALGGRARTWRGGQLDGFIRSDAALYPGFSGGPLVDPSGRLVGMNTTHFGQGVGLAIPVETLKRVGDQLARGGKVRRAFLGVNSQLVALPAGLRSQLGGQEQGLLIVHVDAGSAAEKGGLLVGDILLTLGDTPVQDTQDLLEALTADTIGKALEVKIVRGGQPRSISVTVGERE